VTGSRLLIPRGHQNQGSPPRTRLTIVLPADLVAVIAGLAPGTRCSQERTRLTRVHTRISSFAIQEQRDPGRTFRDTGEARGDIC